MILSNIVCRIMEKLSFIQLVELKQEQTVVQSFFVHTILSSIIWRLLDKLWDVALTRSLQLDLDSKNPVVHVKKSYNCPNLYCLGAAKHLPSQAMNLQVFLTFANRREGNVISRGGQMMAVTIVKNYFFLLLINKELQTKMESQLQ